MPRDFKVYLEDILEAIGKIRAFTKGHTLETLSKDAKTLDAVIRNLEVIGEAVKHIPEDLRGRSKQIEWKKIAGLRDILIHQYYGVDAVIIWDIIQNKLAPLEQSVKSFE